MKKILFIVVFSVIACSKKDSVENSTGSNKTVETNNPEVKENETVLFYMENNGHTVPDKDGISHKIGFEINEISRSPLYQSDNIKDEKGVRFTVGAYKTVFNLVCIDNNVRVDSLNFEGYQFETVPLRPGQTELKGLEWIDVYCANSMAFLPQLENQKVFGNGKTQFYTSKKELISKFTSFNCGNGEIINNQVLQETIEAVKTSGITND